MSLVLSASADVIYSNLQNIVIPADYDGVYLDVNAAGGLYEVSQSGSWDINPFFGGAVLANSPTFQPVRLTDNGLGTLVNIAPGTTIDASSVYSTVLGGMGYGGSQNHLNNTFTAGTEGTLGFKLNQGSNEAPSWAYGWMRVVFTNNAAGAVIKDWAYDDSGAAIVTDNVVHTPVSGTAQTVTLTSSTGSTTLGSAITDSGENGVIVSSLVKTGAGTMVLSGANTYTGTTTVSEGALAINGSTSTGDVTVTGSGTRLMGTGTIGGDTTIGEGAIHAPGNSVGIETFTGDLTYSSGSIFEWEMATTPGTTTRGTDYDAVNVTGTLGGSDAIFRVVLSGSQDFTEGFWNSNQSWSDIFTAANGTTPKTDWANIFSGVQYYNATTGELVAPTSQGSFGWAGNTLTWSAVPEPSSVLAGLLLGAGLLRRRR